MPIMSVRDNENIDRRERQKTKTEMKKGVTHAIVEVWWLNDFVVRLS